MDLIENDDGDLESREYFVVVNDEQQYSIWLADRALPDGWVSTGARGPKAVCLAHIEALWTDMRPRSVRDSLG